MNENIAITNKIKKKVVDSVANHPYLIMIMLFIIICFIAYAFFNYYKDSSSEYKSSSSYYGKDIVYYNPIFKNQANTSSECIERCEKDITCNGITYNNLNQDCIGTGKDGLLRDDDKNLISWVKSSSSLVSDNKKEINIEKRIISGFIDTKTIIPTIKLPPPIFMGNMCFSFNILIKDFHSNFGKWRHIFHKGTEINPGQILNYTSWENLIVDFPHQCIGVWLAPFSNNIRIAITTNYLEKPIKDINSHPMIPNVDNTNTTHKNILNEYSIHPNNLIRNIEYLDYDLVNIPINKIANITINIINRIIEIYIDGKIIRSTQLQGIPEFNNQPLFAKYSKTFDGNISNLIYLAHNATLNNISNILSISNISF